MLLMGAGKRDEYEGELGKLVQQEQAQYLHKL
jgi:hypothetical protein